MHKFTFIFVLSALLCGCATVKLESKPISDNSKKFSNPSSGKSGLYIFRDGNFGGLLKKDIWIDGQCLGSSAPKVFFFTEVEGGKKHQIKTQSEMSTNEISLMTEEGKNYYVRQFLKLGLIVAGADFEELPEDQAKEIIIKLDQATPGQCSKEM
jgi:hypothetical protein